MRAIGLELNQTGYIKEWNLGNTAEIIPRLVGGSPTQYKCDMHNIDINTGLRLLIVNGQTDYAQSGLGRLHSDAKVTLFTSNIGWRSSCIIK